MFERVNNNTIQKIETSLAWVIQKEKELSASNSRVEFFIMLCVGHTETATTLTPTKLVALANQLINFKRRYPFIHFKFVTDPKTEESYHDWIASNKHLVQILHRLQTDPDFFSGDIDEKTKILYDKENPAIEIDLPEVDQYLIHINQFRSSSRWTWIKQICDDRLALTRDKAASIEVLLNEEVNKKVTRDYRNNKLNLNPNEHHRYTDSVRQHMWNTFVDVMFMHADDQNVLSHSTSQSSTTHTTSMQQTVMHNFLIYPNTLPKLHLHGMDQAVEFHLTKHSLVHVQPMFTLDISAPALSDSSSSHHLNLRLFSAPHKELKLTRETNEILSRTIVSIIDERGSKVAAKFFVDVVRKIIPSITQPDSELMSDEELEFDSDNESRSQKSSFRH